MAWITLRARPYGAEVSDVLVAEPDERERRDAAERRGFTTGCGGRAPRDQPRRPYFLCTACFEMPRALAIHSQLRP